MTRSTFSAVTVASWHRDVLRELALLQAATGDAHGLAMTKAQTVTSSPATSATDSHRLLGEALPVLDELGDDWGSAYGWGVLGELLPSEGRAAEAIRERIRSAASPLVESLRAPLLAEHEQALGATAFQVALADGRQAAPEHLTEQILPSAQAEAT